MVTASHVQESPKRRVLIAATSSWFVISVCYLGLAPIYPDIARDLHDRADVFGALLGVSLLVGAALQVPIGILADRFGLRRFALIGVLSAGVAIGLVGGATVAPVF